MSKKPFRLNYTVLIGQIIGCIAVNLLGYGDARSMLYYLSMTSLLMILSLIFPGE